MCVWQGSEFGHNVAASMMKLPKEATVLRRSSREEMQLRMADFKKFYMPCDWTKMLHEAQ